MKTTAWYNYHFWLWDFHSWLCYLGIRTCKSHKEAEVYADTTGWESCDNPACGVGMTHWHKVIDGVRWTDV